MSFCDSCFDSCQRTASKRWRPIWLENPHALTACPCLLGILPAQALRTKPFPTQALYG